MYITRQFFGLPDGFGFNMGQIPVKIEFFTVLLALLLFVDAYVYIKQQPFSFTKRSLRSAAIVATPITLLCICLHEAAHGIVSHVFGIPIVGAGMMPLGAYVSTGIPLTGVPPHDEILVALAGPLTNLVIGLLCAIVVWRFPESLFENTVQYIAYINILLGIFNLYPFLLLDGGKVLDGLLRVLPFFDGNVRFIIEVFVSSFLIFFALFWRKRFYAFVEKQFRISLPSWQKWLREL